MGHKLKMVPYFICHVIQILHFVSTCRGVFRKLFSIVPVLTLLRCGGCGKENSGVHPQVREQRENSGTIAMHGCGDHRIPEGR